MSFVLGMALGALTYIVLHLGLDVALIPTYIACAAVGVIAGVVGERA